MLANHLADVKRRMEESQTLQRQAEGLEVEVLKPVWDLKRASRRLLVTAARELEEALRVDGLDIFTNPETARHAYEIAHLAGHEDRSLPQLKTIHKFLVEAVGGDASYLNAHWVRWGTFGETMRADDIYTLAPVMRDATVLRENMDQLEVVTENLHRVIKAQAAIIGPDRDAFIEFSHSGQDHTPPLYIRYRAKIDKFRIEPDQFNSNVTLFRGTLHECLLRVMKKNPQTYQRSRLRW